MKKIAILGSENTHATGFARVLCGVLKNDKGEKYFPELELCGVYGDKEGNDRIKNTCGFDAFLEDYNELCGKVDGVMVTARHGDNHLKYVRSYLETGIPVWIDKPICASVNDARELCSLLKKYNNLYCGGSLLGLTDEAKQAKEYYSALDKKHFRGAMVTAPVNLVNPYGDWWFYSQHLVSLMMSVFGFGVKSVTAVRNNDVTVSAIFRYDGFDVSALFGADYSVTIFEDNKTHCVPINLDTANFEKAMIAEVGEYDEVIRQGRVLQPLDEFVKPVFVLDAVKRAFETGREVEIEDFKA